MARGVYRRPAPIRRRRFVPPTFAATRVVVRRQRAQGRRRRFLSLRRRPFVGHVTPVVVVSSPPTLRRFQKTRRLGRLVRRRIVTPRPFAATMVLVLRHRSASRRRRGPLGRRRAQAYGTPATGRPVVRVRYRTRLRRRPKPARRPIRVGSVATPANNKNGVLVRMHKAVARMRRAMQARLRWKPRPEELPQGTTDRVIAMPKGRIFTPGVTRGRLQGRL